MSRTLDVGHGARPLEDQSIRTRRTVPLSAQIGVVLLAVLGLWELLSRTEVIDPRLFSSPTGIVQAFLELQAAGEIWHHVGVTVVELLLATVIFTVAGTLLGIVLGLSPLAFEVTYGPIATLFAFPKVTLFPIFIMAVGLGTTSKVLFGAVFGVFPLLMGMMVAVRGIRALHLQLFDAIGASFWFRCSRLFVPSTLPAMVSALRIGFVYAGIGVLLAEMFAAVSGLGNRIVGAGYQSTLDQFWVYVVLTSVILLAGAGALRALEMRLSRWSD
ncbi:ABC transporter permease [Pseudactinotalea sp. HY158]|uniref:ABC transporter permease n=1 Tax=Pseudactinotalea sp. HY158 TaxID=2654547 RepID=UPI00129C1785|nr:ABC transporter permease subunit [Pseudactinotalea sp. HY158]QGH70695.1 ABC transporter permease subunit [Pseudactinotalea sp. HY158]